MLGVVLSLVGMKDRDMGKVMWGKLMVVMRSVGMKDGNLRL